MLLLSIGVLEIYHGMIQKTIYTYKVRHYLKQTYNEPMVIKRVSYLWDNTNKCTSATKKLKRP